MSIRFGDVYKNIKFSGRDLTTFYNLIVVSLQENKEENFGVERVTSYIDDVLIDVVDNRTVIEVTFLRVRNGIELPIDEMFLKEISSLFYKHKDMVTMEVDRKCYRVLPVGGSVRKIGNAGYFTVTFEAEPYAYHTTHLNTTINNASRNVELRNIGVTDVCFDLHLEAVKDGKLTINNHGNKIELEGKAGEDLIINGLTYDSKGLIEWDCDADVFKLMRGVNRIEMEAVGFWNIKFIAIIVQKYLNNFTIE